MNYLLPSLAIIGIGALILMAGILITKEPGQDWQGAFNESLMWGAAFFLSFGTEASLVCAGLN